MDPLVMEFAVAVNTAVTAMRSATSTVQMLGARTSNALSANDMVAARALIADLNSASAGLSDVLSNLAGASATVVQAAGTATGSGA